MQCIWHNVFHIHMHIHAQYYAILAILRQLAATAAYRCVVPPIGPPPPHGVRSPAYFLCSHVFVHLVDTFIYVVAELALIKCEKIIAARDPKTGQWWLVLSLDRATSPLSKKTSQGGQKLGRWQPYIEKKIASIVFLKKKKRKRFFWFKRRVQGGDFPGYFWQFSGDILLREPGNPVHDLSVCNGTVLQLSFYNWCGSGLNGV